MQLAVIPPLLLTFASLVASTDIPQQICVPTRFLPNTHPIAANNIELTIHNTFHIVYQNSNPSVAPDTPNSHSTHQAILVRWSGLVILVVYLIHIQWGRYCYQVCEDQTGRVFQGCPVRRRLPVVGWAPVSTDVSPLPGTIHNDHTHDAPRRAAAMRGRQCAAASDDGAPQHNVLLDQVAALPLLTKKPEGKFNSDNCVTGGQDASSGSGSSSSRTLSPLVQAPPSPANSSSLVQTRSFAGPARKYARRRPFRSGPIRTPDGRQQPPQRDTSSDSFEPAWSTANVFEPIPHRSTRGVPLLATLQAASNVLFVPTTIKWFILVIAVPAEFVHDPKFDLPFLRRVFESSKSANVYFDCLFGKDATFGNIQIKLCSLYRAAQEAGAPSRLLIYLTGMGGGPGGLCIFGDKVITDQNIRSWLAGLRAKSVDPRPAISVFLDACRDAIERQNTRDYGLALVQSCSAGQWAYGIYLGEDLPSSFFVVALFSACHDVRFVSESGSFEQDFTQAFMRRMHELEEYIQFIYYQDHMGSKTCKSCPQGGKCPPPGPQRPEWVHAGLKALIHLGKLIKTEYPDRAREVSDALARKMIKRGFLKTRCSDPPILPPLGRVFVSHNVRSTIQHLRGANQRTSQAVGLGVPVL